MCSRVFALGAITDAPGAKLDDPPTKIALAGKPAGVNRQAVFSI
jgi:hypothetical protein